jgi:NitT/TauT family transport system ATP-binding protein
LPTDADPGRATKYAYINESVYLSDRVILLYRPPSTVLAQVDINISRPRDQIKTKAMQQFVDKRSNIAQMIRRPVSGTT